MKKQLFGTLVIAIVLSFTFSACGAEHEYYRKNQRHSPEYNERNHKANEGERHGDKGERH